MKNKFIGIAAVSCVLLSACNQHIATPENAINPALINSGQAEPVSLGVAELVGLRQLASSGLKPQAVSKLYSKSLLAEDFDGNPFFHILFTAQKPIGDLFAEGRKLSKPKQPEKYSINDMQFQFIGASTTRGEITATGNGVAFLKQLSLAVDLVGQKNIKRFVGSDSTNLLIETKEGRYWDVRNLTILSNDDVKLLRERYEEMLFANSVVAKQNQESWEDNSQQFLKVSGDFGAQSLVNQTLNYTSVAENLNQSGLIFSNPDNELKSQYFYQNLRVGNIGTNGYTTEQCGGWGWGYTCTIDFNWSINYGDGAAGAYAQTPQNMGQSSSDYQFYSVVNGKSDVIGCTNAALLSALGIANYYYRQDIPNVYDGYDSVHNYSHGVASVQYVYGRPSSNGSNSLVTASQSSGSQYNGTAFTNTGTTPDANWLSRINNWLTSKNINMKVDGVYRGVITGTAYPMNYWMFTQLQDNAGYNAIIAHYAVNAQGGGYHSSIITAAQGVRRTKTFGSVADILITTPDQPGVYSSITDSFVPVAGITVVKEK